MVMVSLQKELESQAQRQPNHWASVPVFRNRDSTENINFFVNTSGPVRNHMPKCGTNKRTIYLKNISKESNDDSPAYL